MKCNTRTAYAVWKADEAGDRSVSRADSASRRRLQHKSAAIYPHMHTSRVYIHMYVYVYVHVCVGREDRLTSWMCLAWPGFNWKHL